MHRYRVRAGRGQAGGEGVVHQQAPHVAEGDVPDQVLDVDAAVAEGSPLPVRLGDLRLERDNAFEPGPELGHLPLLASPCERRDPGPGPRRPW